MTGLDGLTAWVLFVFVGVGVLTGLAFVWLAVSAWLWHRE